MSDLEQVATTFYSAFQKRDFAQMQTCYHPNATFEDPAFGELTCKQTKAMWHMLCKRANDLQIHFEILSAQSDTVKVKWIAEYTYSANNSKVKNEVTATLKFKDGKILSHVDQFNFWKWSKQALGFTGVYLGWTPMFRKVVRKSVLNSLTAFIGKNPEYQ